jgi:peptidoglycan/LPS O-acetylase OafA/YrhL
MSRAAPPAQNDCAVVSRRKAEGAALCRMQGRSAGGAFKIHERSARALIAFIARRRAQRVMSPMEHAPATRSARIDFLRGVAIFAVLLHHFSLTYHLIDSPLSAIMPATWVGAVLENGNYGVTIFFVISGFLISSNNLRRYGRLSGVSLRQFYALRFSRIIPPLILALTVIVALGLCGVPSFSNGDGGHDLPASFFLIAVLSVLTFWHNVLMEMVGYFNYCLNIYWSLSVEEVFYLTFPLACVLLKRNRSIAALCAAAIVVGPIYRGLHRDDELYFMYGYAACFDAIAFGCLAALLYPKINVSRVAAGIVRGVAGLCLAAVYFAGIDGHEVLGFSLIAACTACLLVNAFEARREKSRLLPVRVICWFGSHSYELYLFHIIVLAGMRDLVPKQTLPYAYKLPLLVLFLLLSAAVAGAISRYFAEPVNSALRARLGDLR